MQIFQIDDKDNKAAVLMMMRDHYGSRVAHILSEMDLFEVEVYGGYIDVEGKAVLRLTLRNLPGFDSGVGFIYIDPYEAGPTYKVPDLSTIDNSNDSEMTSLEEAVRCATRLNSSESVFMGERN